MHTMPASDCTDWEAFCQLLRTKFGRIDPDAEFWDQLHDLKQGTMTVAQYVHKIQYCFNGSVELPVSDSEKIERFMA